MIFILSFKPKPLFLLEFYKENHKAGNFSKHQDPGVMPLIQHDILFRRYDARNEDSHTHEINKVMMDNCMKLLGSSDMFKCCFFYLSSYTKCLQSTLGGDILSRVATRTLQ